MANWGSSSKAKKTAQQQTTEQQAAVVNAEIMQKLTLMRREVVNLQGEIEGLRSHVEKKNDAVEQQNRIINTLENEIVRLNRADQPHSPHWDNLKLKLQKLTKINGLLSSLIESNFAS